METQGCRLFLTMCMKIKSIHRIVGKQNAGGYFVGDYQRFVAYVYEYLKGKKEKNCGFVKAEAREGVFSMELKLQCPGLAPDTECRVYGFLRKRETLEGIFLGSCRTGEGTVSCRIRTQAENLGGTGVALSQLGGMVFVTELGAFFGTEWDDQPIHPEYFREKATEEQGNGQEEETVAEEKGKSSEGWEDGLNHPDDRQEAIQETLQPDNREIQQGSRQDVSEMRAEEILEEKEEEEPPFMPFDDGEFEICRKIKPQDLLGFSRRECALRHNRFLAYGYYNFGHLLLGKRADGRYILGVPGRYDQQEQFMAGMFGFPYFKESACIRLPQGCGGYWYRLINSPDANGGNGF